MTKNVRQRNIKVGLKPNLNHNIYVKLYYLKTYWFTEKRMEFGPLMVVKSRKQTIQQSRATAII